MAKTNKIWLIVTCAAALFAGIVCYNQTRPKPLPPALQQFSDSIDVLERVDGSKHVSDADYTFIKNGLESGDPGRMRNAMGVAKMTKDPRVATLIDIWAVELVYSKDEDLRHVSIIALSKVGYPGWETKAKMMAKDDPSQFVRDGAASLLK